ncbi:MAG: glucose-6-phosphate dehydrogenase, partial [Nitrospira sp.]|nr:glucose-6-phosphate dehydrogenase [Nitrospira sp.]
LLNQLDGQHGTRGNFLFYLATAPAFFGEIVDQLGAQQLVIQTDEHSRRVVIEKPFGHDLESARSLNHTLR